MSDAGKGNLVIYQTEKRRARSQLSGISGQLPPMENTTVAPAITFEMGFTAKAVPCE